MITSIRSGSLHHDPGALNAERENMQHHAVTETLRTPVSGDFFAHSSYRVTGNATAMGEAVGKVAARAARAGTALTDVSVRRTQ